MLHSFKPCQSIPASLLCHSKAAELHPAVVGVLFPPGAFFAISSIASCITAHIPHHLVWERIALAVHLLYGDDLLMLFFGFWELNYVAHIPHPVRSD
jgi:hypothetical protein